jgi:hypothetical protein
MEGPTRPTDLSAWILGVILGILIGSSVMLGIGHRKPCQMHLPNVTSGEQQQ